MSIIKRDVIMIGRSPLKHRVARAVDIIQTGHCSDKLQLQKNARITGLNSQVSDYVIVSKALLTKIRVNQCLVMYPKPYQAIEDVIKILAAIMHHYS